MFQGEIGRWKEMEDSGSLERPGFPWLYRSCDHGLIPQQFGIPIKTFDTFLPLGPYIETDLDPHNLKVRLVDYFNKLCRTLANHIDPVLTVRNIITTVFSAWIDGEKMQDSNTKNLIFDIPVSPFYYSFQFFQKYFRKFFLSSFLVYRQLDQSNMHIEGWRHYHDWDTGWCRAI